VLLFSILLGTSSGAFACRGIFDVMCNLGLSRETAAPSQSRPTPTANEIIYPFPNENTDPPFAEKAAHDAGKPLTPVREYLRSSEIPPPGAGAYGIVILQSKATSANRSKLLMVCHAFVAFFPRSETAAVPISDQMITIWPIDNPDSAGAKADDCDFVVDHYDLIAAEAAISDAQKQLANFDGEGPYLVGWSPSNSRGVAGKLVLVVDMSTDNSQALIDHKFLFWKIKIVQNPSLWRSGFSFDLVRVAIHDFADQYGQAMLDAIKLTGENKP
jgi:hypothetical protein